MVEAPFRSCALYCTISRLWVDGKVLPVCEGVKVPHKDLLEQVRVGHVQVSLDAAELTPHRTVPGERRG